MSDSVLGALISAGASILIAIINKITESSESDGSPKGQSPAHPGTPQVAISTVTQRETQRARGWYISLGVLLVWMALSPALVHHDWAGMNFSVIPVVIILLALVVPIPPLKAAWMSLAMFAANFVIGPMSNRLHGSAYDTAFVGGNARGESPFLEFLLLSGGGTAAVASGICFFRRKYDRHRTVEQPDRNGASLAAELEKLGQLRTTGVLSETEFQRAKEKLLELSAHADHRTG